MLLLKFFELSFKHLNLVSQLNHFVLLFKAVFIVLGRNGNSKVFFIITGFFFGLFNINNFLYVF